MYYFAFSNLGKEFVGLRNLLIEFLSHIPRQKVLQKVRHIYSNERYELKEFMLKLFNKIGRWSTNANLMIGTIDVSENIRNISVGYVQEWKRYATRLQNHFLL